MKQFGTILKFEFVYYLKNKIFVGVTLFLVALIAVVMFFPRVEKMLFQEETKETPIEASIMLVQGVDTAWAEFAQKAFAAAFPEYEVQLTDISIEEVKAEIVSGAAECAFVMKDALSYTYYVNNLSMYDMNPEIAAEVLQNMYQMEAMVYAGMTVETANEIMNVELDAVVESLGKNQMENFLYTYIMIFALYMVILLYGQMVSTNVATEKSSRAMEVLITSAKPTAMMFGKVLASCFAGLIQLIAVFGSALFCYDLNKSYWGENDMVQSIFNIPPSLLVYMLIFFVLGFLIYAFLFGAIGSMATKLEDINTSTMPLMLLYVSAFMVVIISMNSGEMNNTLMKVCSFIPFTSPMAMFTRIAMSTVPLYEILISMIILIGSVAGVGVLSAKIYRVGVLMYGTTPKLGAILKAVWRA